MSTGMHRDLGSRDDHEAAQRIVAKLETALMWVCIALILGGSWYEFSQWHPIWL